MFDFTESEKIIIIVVVVAVYVLIMSLVGFISMGADKSKSKKGAWRTKESTLLLISALGGSFGSFIGMQVFRHKTKHAKFVILVPLSLVVHIALIGFMVWKFMQ